MPQINRIRVNNVKYNFGTQFYDDFIMRFSGKNTIYDLANGGGKSVLMLLLLQNMIPNCTLDDKQPIEKLFRTGSGSNTIHSLVEWNLSDVHVKKNYKYMLTGFCARKAKDEDKFGENSAAIDYFNYVIFYREYNDNDLKNLPLSVPGNKNPNVKERITYNGLKNYLRDLEKKDYSLEVRIFERKGDYQKFISDYGIYESEWEIIRGINKTEGHVRTYFETNYKTTRKVVEDLLIEQIIEKSFKNSVFSGDHAERHENTMVETLIDIKDKLVELSEKKNDIHNYDRQMELIGDFVEQVGGIKKLYFGKEGLEQELIAGYKSLHRVIELMELEKKKIKAGAEELEVQKMLEKKAIDTVNIQKNVERKEALRGKSEQLKEQEQGVEEHIDILNTALTIAESINDYLDYLYYKKERDTIRENIESITKDEGQLFEELQNLAAEKKVRDLKRFQNIKSLYTNEEEELLKEESIAEGLKIRYEELGKNQAIAQYKIEEGKKNIEEYNCQIAELKHSINLLMVYDLKKEKKLNEGEQQECQRQIEENQSKIDQILEAEKNLKTEIISLQESISEIDQKLSDNVDKRMGLSQFKTRFEKIKNVYKEKNTGDLAAALAQKQEKSENKKSQLEQDKQKKSKYVMGLKRGCPVEESEEVQAVLAYLNRFHGDYAISGADYIENMGADKKQKLLECAPMLPYSVVVKKNYESVTGDSGLYQLQLGSYHVAVINEKALQDEEYLSTSDVTYSMCKKELFFDEKSIQIELAKTENEIMSIDADLERLLDNIEAYRKDGDFVQLYRNEYESQIEEFETAYEELRLLRKEKETYLLQKKEEEDTFTETKAAAAREVEVLEEKGQKLRKKGIVIGKVIELNDSVSALEVVVQEAEKLFASASTELLNVKGRLDAWENKEVARKKVLANLKKEEDNLKADWERYRRYYNEDKSTDAEVYKVLSDAEIEAKFAGIADALEGGNSTIADKQKLLDNYEVAMEKSLQAIDYKGIRVEEVKTRYDQGQTGTTSKDELLEHKKKIQEKSLQLKEIKKNIANLQSEMDKLEGAVNNGKEAIIQKYGNFENIVLNGVKPEDFISEKKQIIQNIDEQMAGMNENLKSIEDKKKKYELYLHDMEKVVTEELIHRYQEEKVDYSENILENVEKSLMKYEKFHQDILERKDEFEQEKNQLISTLRLMNFTPLADELNINAIMPDSVSETEQLMEGLQEIIHCLELEKERIAKSIADMERIKENFESQCIQSCINIKTELEKLPKLSRIVMDGESIPIISLSIPFIEEELYKEKMSKYINETVKQADTMLNEGERVKFIKSRLSWKKLFAVIVTDMNSIRLNLYKRERIKEQSRYLKYEEAVGSTGQSQGIYIQFLIAVINYISSIHSRDTDSVALLKVIFIDNPFGAAKDIYIWEPIFKMLKTNNVQLVVPCRGATPAITGRFDVNYVLGQKLIDGKQQTVVVDYYSNLNSDRLDYVTMTYEQENLEFLT